MAITARKLTTNLNGEVRETLVEYANKDGYGNTINASTYWNTTQPFGSWKLSNGALVPSNDATGASLGRLGDDNISIYANNIKARDMTATTFLTHNNGGLVDVSGILAIGYNGDHQGDAGWIIPVMMMSGSTPVYAPMMFSPIFDVTSGSYSALDVKNARFIQYGGKVYTAACYGGSMVMFTNTNLLSGNLYVETIFFDPSFRSETATYYLGQ